MIKRGVGVGCMWYGIGNTGLPNPAAAFVEVHADGTVTVLTGCADIGQGSDTVLSQIVAEVFGIDYEDVFITSGDTFVTPEAGATSASRQTYISGNACYNAAVMARETLLKVAGEILCEDKDNIILKDKKAVVKDDESKFITFSELMGGLKSRGLIAVGSGSFNPNTTLLNPENMNGVPYATYAYATHVAEVEVNTETGEVNVVKVVAAHDVGKAINKKNVEGQIEGGCLMGMGYALSEKVDINEGRIKNPNFTNYIIPTAKDMPDIYPIIIEEEEVSGPFGAKGVGEPALIPCAPAILNAIYDAIGIRFTEIPVTPDVLLKKLKNKEA